jgi:hypothetical protein
MKAFALMIVSASIYALLGNVSSEVINGYLLNADASFALFVIGFGVGVYLAYQLEWID